MTIAELPADVQAAVRIRYRRELDDLDYRRQLRVLAEQGYSQRQISRWLGVTQPSIQSILQTAARDPRLIVGFSGATPLEICERYAAGLIDRGQLVDELARWNYTLAPTSDGVDWLTEDVAGSWADVSDAHRRGLIDDTIYEEVFLRRGTADSAA